MKLQRESSAAKMVIIYARSTRLLWYRGLPCKASGQNDCTTSVHSGYTPKSQGFGGKSANFHYVSSVSTWDNLRVTVEQDRLGLITSKQQSYIPITVKWPYAMD